MLTRPGTKNIEWNSAEFPTVPASTHVTVNVIMPTIMAAITANRTAHISVRRNLGLATAPRQPDMFMNAVLAIASNP